MSVNAINKIESLLTQHPKTWLVTGAAGFIGSHLIERLLTLGQKVIALDNFATGSKKNLAAVQQHVGDALWSNLRFTECDIREFEAVATIFAEQPVDCVLHQAALGSVPRSISEPTTTAGVNVGGFQNVIEAARKTGVKRLVYASSSSVYGDDTSPVKHEDKVGSVLSPYAASKAMNETWATSYASAYGMECVGLRYFNVFGPRQDPAGPYAAVIARWMNGVLNGEECVVYGDGTTSRDFCYVKNVVQANILAAVSPLESKNLVLNIGCHATTTLSQLWDIIVDVAAAAKPQNSPPALRKEARRAGDILHSFASIELARSLLGYAPTHDLRAGIVEAMGYALEEE